MSAFHRFVLSTSIILTFVFFAASSAFASITYKYYQSDNYAICDKNIQPICDYTVTSWGSNPNYTYGACSATTSQVQVARKQKTYTYTQNPDGTVTTNTVFVDSGFSRTGAVLSKVCPDNTTLILRGCTATCEVDPCDGLKNQEFSGNGECGSFSCPNGGIVQSSGNTSYCSKGTPTLSYSPPQLGVNTQNSCAGVYKSHVNNASVEPSLNGATGGSFYCSATFTYTGKTGTPENEKTLNALTGGATAMPPDGICKDPTPLSGTLNGQPVCYPNELPDSPCPILNEKPNSNGVCVAPDDPTYPKDTDPNKDPNDDNPNTCPKGQIKNLSGVCVPYGDATECPTGQKRNNMGLCGADPNANKCPTGQVKNAQGVCANDPRGTGCADGSLPNSLGVCANGTASCSVGQTRNAQGVCISASSGSGCKDGSTANSLGMCADGSASCGSGKVRNAQGVCVTDTTDPSQKTSASFATGCENAPSCDGDPIQCAIYEHQWRSNCDLIRAPNENEKAAVKGAIDDTNAQMDGLEADYKNSVDAIISGSGLLNNPVPTTSSCIPDKQIVIVNGLSVNVPFSLLCPYFSLMRSMLILVAYLFAARIVYAELTGGGIRV